MSEKDEIVVSIEEVSGGDQEQPADTIHEEAIETSREEKIKKLWEAIAEDRPTIEEQKQNSQPKIQRVPFMLGDHKNFDKYYEPRLIAFGPYHHGKVKYELAEKIKLQLAAYFPKDSGQLTIPGTLLKRVVNHIKDLRECYDEEATKDYDDEALAWMLFVDGCSMLEFIYKYTKLEEFNIKRDQAALSEQDMFLLENQLPYPLLMLLMSSSHKLEELKFSIEIFVDIQCVTRGDQVRKRSIPVMEIRNLHLLDYIRTTMVGQPRSGRQRSISNGSSKSFGSVEEHRQAGINFRLSESPSLGDIYFKSRGCRGFLYLPNVRILCGLN